MLHLDDAPNRHESPKGPTQTTLEVAEGLHMVGYQNNGPHVGPYGSTAPHIQGTQKGGQNFDILWESLGLMVTGQA